MATKKAPQILTPTPSALATGLAVVPKPKRTAPESTFQKMATPKKPVVPKATPKKQAVAASQKPSPKRKTKAAAKPESVVSLEVLHDEIRRESYDYYIQRGYHPGDPNADWLRAEDAVLRRHGLR